MDKSINLSLDENIKRFAQQYAKEHRTSVSAMVESFFRVLMIKDTKDDKELSRIDRLIAELPDVEIPEDIDDLKYQYLKEKYLD